MDIAELVSELRDGSRRGTDTCVQAADALESLHTENERLRREIKDLRDVVCDELTAEGQRLGFY